MTTDSRLPLALTVGEPAGIGPELCLAIAGTPLANDVVVISDRRVLESRAKRLGVSVSLSTYDPERPTPLEPRLGDALRVMGEELPRPDVCGDPSTANAAGILRMLKRATSACVARQFAGLVTAPMQKSVIADAGLSFSGHTEFIAAETNTPTPVMLLVAERLRVALASTHMPLSAVPAYITEERLDTVLRILHNDLKQRFGIADPEIVVCGLNPHAGEGGHLGHEDAAVIEPTVRNLQAGGMRVRGPLPADTAFTPAAGHADAVLAMYHDQGLPVLKYAGFGNAVNVTLGLPIVRTSVDHGTALDIAGSGTADSGSLRAAIQLAKELCAA